MAVSFKNPETDKKYGIHLEEDQEIHFGGYQGPVSMTPEEIVKARVADPGNRIFFEKKASASAGEKVPGAKN